MAGIKETQDVIKLAAELASAIERAKADGKIDWMDLPKLGGVVSAAKDAMEGSSQIDDELKDLDSKELQILLSEAVAALSALGKAFLSK